MCVQDAYSYLFNNALNTCAIDSDVLPAVFFVS